MCRHSLRTGECSPGHVTRTARSDRTVEPGLLRARSWEFVRALGARLPAGCEGSRLAFPLACTIIHTLPSPFIYSLFRCRFTEWAQRTPLVSRWGTGVVLLVTLLGMLTGLSEYLAVVPADIVLRGQVWRLFTGFFDQGSIFTLLFVMLAFATQSPALEIRMGSTPLLLHILSLGTVINLLLILVTMLLFLIPDEFAQSFALSGSRGLWPVLMCLISINCLSDPTGSSSFFCFTLNNRLFPWMLVTIFSLISFSPQIDLILGVVVGHLWNFNLLRWMKPSSRRIASWETEGWAARIGMTRAQGYVYAPDTALPTGARDVDREAMASQFGLFGARPGARDAANARGGPAQDQDAESGGGGGGQSYMFRAGRNAPSATTGAARSASASGAGGAAATTFPGEGQRLGSAPTRALSGPAPASGAASGGPSVSAILAGLMTRNPNEAVAASAPSNSAADPMAARRQAAAAAAEARLRSAASRGVSATTPNAATNDARQQQLQQAAQDQADPLDLLSGNSPTAAPVTAGSQRKPAGGYARAVAAASASASGGGGAASRPISERSALLSSESDSFDDEFDELYADTAPPKRATAAAPAPAPAPAPVVPSAPSAPSASDRAAAISLLADMGFPRIAAEQALAQAGGDLEAAVVLLSNQ
jgi:hypothetical protein